MKVVKLFKLNPLACRFSTVPIQTLNGYREILDSILSTCSTLTKLLALSTWAGIPWIIC